MISCHDMKEGEIYACESCGLELKVVKACNESHEDECGCSGHEPCEFSCCGSTLKKKD